MKRKGSTTSIVIATIAGLSVLGIAGYRIMSGDCSSCAITGAEVSTTAVAAKGDSCCPLKADSDATATLVATGESCESACSDKASCSDKAAQAELVSTTTEKSCESACSEKASCSDKATQVEMISTTTEASECGSACAGDACGKDADACCGKCDAGKELAKAPQ